MRTSSALAILLALPIAGAEIRVGVFGLFKPERVTVKPAPGSALKLTAGSRQLILNPNQAAGIRAVGSEVDLFAHRATSSARSVRVSARDGGSAEFAISVPGKIERLYRGTLAITAGAGVLSVVLEMDLQTAVASAVSAELPPESPDEALKAMAVLARSYYSQARGRHRGFDFCDTTHCQFHRSPPDARSPAAKASSQTDGLVIAYDGVPFAAMYSASCGGRTRSAADARLPPGEYPYSRVECSSCQRERMPWTRRLPLEEAAELLLEPTEENRLRLVRRLGWSAVPSSNFRMHREGQMIVLEGRGEGHGIGVCQRGAIAMAKEGIDFRSILMYYLPGTQLIFDKR